MVPQLVIDLQTLTEDQVFVLKGEYEINYTQLVIGLCPVSEPVQYSIEIRKNQQDFFVHGKVCTKVLHPCIRCLHPVELTIEGEVEVILLASEHEPKEDEVELKTLENVVYYRGSEFDLLPFIEEAILLDVPNTVLCKESCLGLCPYCGQNRNDQPDHRCNLQEEKLDERFRVLEALQRELEEDESDRAKTDERNSIH